MDKKIIIIVFILTVITGFIIFAIFNGETENSTNKAEPDVVETESLVENEPIEKDGIIDNRKDVIYVEQKIQKNDDFKMEIDYTVLDVMKSDGICTFKIITPETNVDKISDFSKGFEYFTLDMNIDIQQVIIEFVSEENETAFIIYDGNTPDALKVLIVD